MNFKYCIWLIPNKTHIWYNYTNGFIPHLTIKSKMNYKDAQKLYNFLNIEPLKIKLCHDIIYSIEKKFHALYFPVKLLGVKPEWWPNNPHISFRYQYNKSFNQCEIENLKKLVSVFDGELVEIKLVKCSGHFKNWIILK